MARLLSALREAGLITPAIPQRTEHEVIFQAFNDYLKNERGLMPTSVLRRLPVVRQFLRELCPLGTADLGKLDQEDIIRYVECHASDRSADTGKAMCWALRAFLRYLYFKGLVSRMLADCIPRSGDGSSQAYQHTCLRSRFRAYSTGAIGPQPSDDGIMPS